MGCLPLAVAYRDAPKPPRLSLAPFLVLCGATGPKVNTPEKLAELRRAGVNIGTFDTHVDPVSRSDSVAMQYE